MTQEEVIEEIKFELTGGVLELEITDLDIAYAIKKALRELERYWAETTLVTVPFASCIDLEGSELDLKEKVSSIVKVYRIQGYGDNSGWYGMNDPLYAQLFLIFSGGGTMYSLNDYVLNYASWNTLLLIKNTITTDLAFEEDRHNNKLYISPANDRPDMITIKYIPKLRDVSDIKEEYWIDVLIKMSLCLVKIILGRIRTRFTQSGALWAQDGDKLLEEGNTGLAALRESLANNDNLIYGID